MEYSIHDNAIRRRISTSIKVIARIFMLLLTVLEIENLDQGHRVQHIHNDNMRWRRPTSIKVVACIFTIALSPFKRIYGLKYLKLNILVKVTAYNVTQRIHSMANIIVYTRHKWAFIASANRFPRYYRFKFSDLEKVGQGLEVILHNIRIFQNFSYLATYAYAKR